MRIGLWVILAVMATPALSEVVDMTPQGFALKFDLSVDAPPAKVFDAMVHPERWWSSAHTFSQDAAHLSLDAQAGGCFCERWAGGSVEHGRVVYIAPGRALTLRGPLGPFQPQGVDGALVFELEPERAGTRLTLVNRVGGYMQGGFGAWAGKADAMLAEQMARLKQFVETGSPVAAKP